MSHECDDKCFMAGYGYGVAALLYMYRSERGKKGGDDRGERWYHDGRRLALV